MPIQKLRRSFQSSMASGKYIRFPFRRRLSPYGTSVARSCDGQTDAKVVSLCHTDESYTFDHDDFMEGIPFEDEQQQLGWRLDPVESHSDWTLVSRNLPKVSWTCTPRANKRYLPGASCMDSALWHGDWTTKERLSSARPPGLSQTGRWAPAEVGSPYRRIHLW